MLLAINLTGHATTYFVDNCDHIGSDDHLGNSPMAAWLTLAKVNATPLSPGDIVRLRRGCTWQETLRPHNSGQLGRPILFNAYGPGPKPLLHGGTVVGKHWRSTGNGLYRFNPHGFPSGVFRNDSLLSAVTSLTALRSSQQYLYDHQYIWIRSPTDPNSSGDHFDISQRSAAIEVHNLAHLRFDGLRTAYASGVDVDASNAADISFLDVDGFMGGGAGFYCQAGSHDIRLIGGTWSGAGWSGHDGDNIAVGGNDPGTASFACRALLVQGTQLSGATEACIAVDTTSNNSISSDIRLIGNDCHHSQQYGIFIGGAHRNVVIQSNVIAYNGRSGIVFNEGTSGMPSGIICNNTLWANGLHASGDNAGNIQLQSSDVIVVNNLIANARGSEIVIGENRNPKLDYNLYRHPSGTAIFKQGSSTFASIAAWTHAGEQDTHSRNADPRLKDPLHGDFRPDADSPAIRSGKNLGLRFALALNASPDPASLRLVARPADMLWNIGAY